MAKRSRVDISLGEAAAQCRVTVDGRDITDCIRAVDVRAEAGEITKAKLEVYPWSVRLEGDPDIEVMLLDKGIEQTTEEGA